ncbi:ATP-binding protein [Vibrio sp. TH_r3]|uniref:ATP-binding protein n=1 Tax=Vibrio sp. TH_r3 TaxID=3082084 RepID=UPI0029558030|nr:ATP-binding protein [Vibrio sp. TH_r3]MDV7105397.1 ATP-binding protein [Vibrio sp. TH_r3]
MNRICTACYIDAEIQEYEGHPLINALPPINSPEQTAKLLFRYPKITDEERALPGHIKRHAMMRILDKFLYPTKAHSQLEQMISGMIRSGYLSRNIADKSYVESLNAVDRVKSVKSRRNAGNEALVSSVIGCSGAGKSTAVEAILNSYEQAILHPDYQHVQLVWLKLECPHDGSVKSLCINFFRAVDEALNTDYQETYVKPRSSAESLLGDIARVAALHSIGILVIDEIQHLDHFKSGGSDRILNFFVALTNVIKIPVLFVGTPKANQIFSPTMRSARRAAQFGSLNWGRFNRSTQPQKDDEWEKFFARLWKLQWFQSPVPLTDGIRDLFWEYTQGIAHIAVVLFYLCQVRAVIVGKELIDRKLVEKVYNEELSIVHPMINALRGGREEEILKYADLDLPLKEVLVLAEGSDEVIEDALEQDESSLSSDKQSQLVALLKQFNIGSDLAPILAKQAMEQFPNEDLFGLVAKVKELKDPTPQIKKKKQKKELGYTPVYISNDLRIMRDDDPEFTYQNLVKGGVVIDLMQYMS